MLIKFIPMIIGAYLLGSMPTAFLVAKWRRGIDIRQHGSGNVGAANVLATVSKRWSIVVTIFDVGKGALVVWVAQRLELGVAQQVTVGITAIIGHNWPIFLRFQGGRGIFTSFGVITMLSPKLGLIALVFSYLFAPFHLLPLGVIIALIAIPILSWVLSQPLGIEEPLPITLGFLVILLIALTRRLAAPRSPISASLSAGELIINRLLFDRDIRDRKTWISQTRSEADSIEQPIEQEGEQR